MADLLSKSQPSFLLFKQNNNRTGYQPVNLPLVLVVPHVRSAAGIPINGSEICDLTYLIEDAPGKSPVAAPANIGKYVPNYERFRLTIDNLQLASVKIDVTGLQFYDINGDTKDYADAIDGDLMEYGLLRGTIGADGKSGPGVIDLIPYYKHADYYDLSPFIIETYDLPVGNYNFIYEVLYNKRLVSSNDELICIDITKKIPSRHVSFIKHPGELHDAMIRNTPSFYFSAPRIDKDSTVAFYRPFADALQDIFDEQELIKGINFVDKIPGQYIPYLAYLLGIDVPYFDPSTDNIRRALIKNGRRLQQLKGSSRAIKELFEICGFIIDISNLWYSKSGDRFIAPNEKLPDTISDQEITTSKICHSEPIANAYKESGFGQFEVPLLFRPLGNITVDAWLVEDDSDADTSLTNAVNATSIDINAFSTDTCSTTIQGFKSTSLQPSIPVNGVIGKSTILINQDDNGIDEVQYKNGKPLNANSIKYDKNRNSLKITFDRFLNLKKHKVYIFSTYEYNKIILPDALADLKSNRFDINIILFKDGEQPPSYILEFLLEYLFRFKAFHSLLRKITFSITIDDIYNVIDFCAGGVHAQSPFTDAGQLQTVPPFYPDNVATDSDGNIICTEDNINISSKSTDIALRTKILDLLANEHKAWKNLDGLYDVPPNMLPLLQSASRVTIRSGDDIPCEYNKFGQDRVISADTKDFDHTEDQRSKLCDLTTNSSDYCYKGRVQQDVETYSALILDEIVRCKPCNLSMGYGSYYMTPLVPNDEFSGGDAGTNAADLTDVNNLRRSHHDGNYVRVMAFDNAQIHYTNRDYLDNINDTINNRYFAGRKPSLEVVKDNMFIPGHRFMSMANLENDLVHPTYNLKPWDYLYDLCPEYTTGMVIPDLNPRLVTATDGSDEYLVFDEYDLIYYGNGFKADIPSMGDHELSDINPNDIAHSIWSSNHPGLSYTTYDGNNISYVIDQTEDGIQYPIRALNYYVDTICFTDLLGPIFKSANLSCNCDDVDDAIAGRSIEDILPENTGITGGTGTESELIGGVDYIDGYPADFGYYSVDLYLYDFPREHFEGYGFSVYDSDGYGGVGAGTDNTLAIVLQLPLVDENIVQLKFKVGSGIRVSENDPNYDYYKPYRLDCGSLQYECPTGATFNTLTENTNASDQLVLNRDHTSFYRLPDGSYDWHCDKVTLESKLILNDQYGAYTYLMDGTIPNMMSFTNDITYNTLLSAFGDLPSEGNYKFVDEYGVIHSASFETSGDKLDITDQVFDPRVWGKSPTGEVKNYKVFRDGITTIERKIIQVTDFGYLVISEGSIQQVNRAQTTFGCGDDLYVDPFAYHLDANIVDDVEFIASPGTGGSSSVILTGFGRGGFGSLSFGGGPSS